MNDVGVTQGHVAGLEGSGACPAAFPLPPPPPTLPFFAGLPVVPSGAQALRSSQVVHGRWLLPIGGPVEVFLGLSRALALTACWGLCDTPVPALPPV